MLDRFESPAAAVDPRAPLFRHRRNRQASSSTRQPRVTRGPSWPSSARRPARRSTPAITALSDQDTCISRTRRPRAMRPPIIATVHAPARPSIHATRHRRVYMAALRSTSSASSPAASGPSTVLARAPRLRWSLRPCCPSAGAALVARVLVARCPTPLGIAGFISDSAATPPSPSGVPDLARDWLDHLLAAVIRLIYASRPTWPVGCSRLRRSREDHLRVQCAPPPIEQWAAAASAPSGRSAAAPSFSLLLHRLVRRRCVAPLGRSAAICGPRRRPKVVPAVAPTRAWSLRRPFGP